MPTSSETFGEFTPGHDIVSAFGAQVNGKIILITGANPGGIGYSTATSLAAASPKLLILAGRGLEKLSKTAAGVHQVNPNVPCRSLILDLSSQKSVRKAAEEIMAASDVPQIDILINSAGVMQLPQRTLSPEGIEMTLATNHIGHFLFTNLILPKMKISATSSEPGSTRIVNVSSLGVRYSAIRFSDYNFTKTDKDLPEEERVQQETRDFWDEHEDKPYIPAAAYGQSKTANILFSVELNKRLFAKTGISSKALHPGGINTQLNRHLDQEKWESKVESFRKLVPGFRMKDLDEGCSTTLVAALDPKLTEEDLVFDNCQLANWVPAYATDSQKAEQLWKLSEQLVGETFFG